METHCPKGMMALSRHLPKLAWYASPGSLLGLNAMNVLHDKCVDIQHSLLMQGDAGNSWRRKKLMRLKEQAAEDGKDFKELVWEHFGKKMSA